jgi:tRNA A37 threonylcarbamoyladenosine dehydratase
VTPNLLQPLGCSNYAAKSLKSGQKAPLDTKLAKITKTGQKPLKKDFREKIRARDDAVEKITDFWTENSKKVKNLRLKSAKSVSKVQPKFLHKISTGNR